MSGVTAEARGGQTARVTLFRWTNLVWWRESCSPATARSHPL